MKATEEIGTQIHRIKHSTQEAVEAIRSITEVIEEVSAIATSIASAVEEHRVPRPPILPATSVRSRAAR